MAELVNPANIPQQQQEELEAYLREMKTDYNQRHFVRNEKFKEAAEKLSGPTRKIFVEFLERSCTAEFSGFLLFKELARRLRDVNPTVAGALAGTVLDGHACRKHVLCMGAAAATWVKCNNPLRALLYVSLL